MSLPAGAQGLVSVCVTQDGQTALGSAAYPLNLNINQTSARQFVGPFVRDNIAASLTNSRAAVGATGAPQLDITMPRAGYLTAITVSLTVAPAGSNPVITVFKNGSALDATAILTVTAGATLVFVATFTSGNALLAFAATDKLGVAITTDGSWTATTSDATVLLEVQTAL